MVTVNDSIVPGWDSPDYFRLFSEGSAPGGPNETGSRPGRSPAFGGLPANHSGVQGVVSGANGSAGSNSSGSPAAVANGAYQVQVSSSFYGDRNETRLLGGGGGSTTVGPGGDDRDRGGSNFMLLLEDFGEYFYNYNGTGPPNDTLGLGGGTSAGFPINCTVANTTCDLPSEGKST